MANSTLYFDGQDCLLSDHLFLESDVELKRFFFMLTRGSSVSVRVSLSLADLTQGAQKHCRQCSMKWRTQGAIGRNYYFGKSGHQKGTCRR